MTSFRIERLNLTPEQVRLWGERDVRHHNWPVVYALHGSSQVYVGESLNAAARFRQHLASEERRKLGTAHVVIDDRFNKSVCLDLESFLIRLLAGDGRYGVLNRNVGVTDSDYYDREHYRETFRQVFEQLLDEGVFTRKLRDIENTDLFKLSPFKALTHDQSIAVEDILDGLFDDLERDVGSRIVIQGDPGTGKTVVAIYLLKLLSDIRDSEPGEEPDSDTLFSDYFMPGYSELLRGLRFALVVPQQSLRRSVQKVFAKTPGLSKDLVLSPFDVGKSEHDFDLLVVDEAHRLSQRSNQSSGMRNREYQQINEALFGVDDPDITQLDWIDVKSRHQIYLVDSAQSVRPGDVLESDLRTLISGAESQSRLYRLATQMRVGAGSDYVTYVRQILSGERVEPRDFPGYDLRLFDNLGEMRTEIRRREAEVGLARLVAGFAWPWRTKRDKSAYDIEEDGLRLRWNGTEVDWVNSRTSLEEVGSIHTIQGYDLNYAGVIIGRDLRFDRHAGRIEFDRSHYFDKKGMENNPRRGLTYDDEEILRYIKNIYAVLLTRGMLGTYVYVVDAELRQHLRRYFAGA
jgi:uncharacterized protein